MSLWSNSMRWPTELVADGRGVPWATVATGALETHAVRRPTLLAAPGDRPDHAWAGRRRELPDRCVLTGARWVPGRMRPTSLGCLDPAARHVLVTTGGLAGDLAAGFHRGMAAALAPMASGVQAVFVTSSVAATRCRTTRSPPSGCRCST